MIKRLFVLIFILFSFSFFNILGIRPQLVWQHILFFGGAVGIFFLVRWMGFRFFYEHAWVWYLLFVGLLLFTYIIGFEARGSKRWIDIGFFNFQPSEFFKVFFGLFLAYYLTHYRRELDEPGAIVRILALAAIPTLIIFLQPDLGSALVYMVIFVVSMVLSAVPRRTLLKLAAPLVVLVPVGWLFLKEYQRARLVSFIYPQADALGSGYNVLQAKITAGSGGLLGKGLGFGTQTKLFFLPENHTDFAFASLVEQFGFLGGAVLIVAYILLFILLIRRSIKWGQEHDALGQVRFMYGMSFACALLFQAIVNIGMNLGILPVTGITLPFVSYGGSSLLSLMIGMALLM